MLISLNISNRNRRKVKKYENSLNDDGRIIMEFEFDIMKCNIIKMCFDVDDSVGLKEAKYRIEFFD